MIIFNYTLINDTQRGTQTNIQDIFTRILVRIML